jgi:hypothetical protein
LTLLCHLFCDGVSNDNWIYPSATIRNTHAERLTLGVLGGSDAAQPNAIASRGFFRSHTSSNGKPFDSLEIELAELGQIAGT